VVVLPVAVEDPVVVAVPLEAVVELVVAASPVSGVVPKSSL
jgi:hypothetical protein